MERATIRKAGNGYIVEVRWPYGPSPLGCGELAVMSFAEAVELLAKHCEAYDPLTESLIVSVGVRPK